MTSDWLTLMSVNAASGIHVKDMWTARTSQFSSEYMYNAGIIAEQWNNISKVAILSSQVCSSPPSSREHAADLVLKYLF